MTRRTAPPLFLLELVVMILVFALCAGILMNIFASARETAREGGDLGRVAALADSAAAAYRAAGGAMDETAAALDAVEVPGGLAIYLDSAWQRCREERAVYILSLTPGDREADVTVERDGTELFSLAVRAVPYE